MPNRGRVQGHPRDYLRSGTWPDGTIRKGAPAAVWWAAEISKRLAAALDDDREQRTLSELALEVDLARSTIYKMTDGSSWPDVVSIVKLQDALGVKLWPDWEPGSKP